MINERRLEVWELEQRPFQAKHAARAKALR